jgi:CPA1 family monovalent cation:H+ antiporter
MKPMTTPPSTSRIGRAAEASARARAAPARHEEREDDGSIEEGSVAYQGVVRELLDAERARVVALRNDGIIDDAVMQRVQRDLDLEAARLDQSAWRRRVSAPAGARGSSA